MKVLVCGGRHYEDLRAVYGALDRAMPAVHLVIHGGARGADAFAEMWAHEYAVPCLRHPANWERYGRAAGMRRNAEMLRWRPDAVLWFPGGSGTEGMKRLAAEAGIRLIDGEALANGQV